jgi:GST-like protein
MNDASNNLPPGYMPPKVWRWAGQDGGEWTSINRPVSGATHDKVLPIGEHPIQLYSLGTPNGQKVTIMLEELLALGHSGAEYDAWYINIGAGEQFGSGFVDINPNSKIPAMMDHSTTPPTRLFESASMLVYLAEKFGEFYPQEHYRRAETMNWLMWQMGSAPFLGGGFGHFYAYAPFRIEYAIDRYAMETKRLLHVLDTHLQDHEYLAGDVYTIADIANWPWYGSIMNDGYNAGEFLSVHEYKNLRRWVDMVGSRPAVQRGQIVNRGLGPLDQQLRERHHADDFQNNTQDKIEARKESKG